MGNLLIVTLSGRLLQTGRARITMTCVKADRIRLHLGQLLNGWRSVTRKESVLRLSDLGSDHRRGNAECEYRPAFAPFGAAADLNRALVLPHQIVGDP